MKKIVCLMALAAISFGSVMAAPVSAVNGKLAADTVVKKTVKAHKTKVVKKKSPKKDTTKM